MDALLQFVIEGIKQMPYWEECAVALGIIYLLLAMRQHIACWYAAFLSTLIYTFLFWDVRLLMESGLQVYYLLMAVFGWWQWRKNDPVNAKAGQLVISSWSNMQHLIAITAVVVLALISGQLLASNTDAAHPFVDSFTTWGAVITTYMVTRKILENWIYWFVIDGISIFLYLDRGLYPTAALFVAYEVIVIFGYLKWRKEFRQQAAPTS